MWYTPAANSLFSPAAAVPCVHTPALSAEILSGSSPCNNLFTVRRPNDACSWRSHAVSKPSSLQEKEYHIDAPHNGLPPAVQWPDEGQKLNGKGHALEVAEVDWIVQRVSDVKAILGSMGDGEISISAYDTAWVALVEDIHGRGGAQFPSSLQWISDNQLPDGSWGDRQIFTAHDRLINTLSCVIALKKWSVCPDRCEKGIEYLRKNMHRLEEEDPEHMPIGFEVAFPSLVEVARTLDLEIPYDSPALQQIYAMRKLKLERIPKEMMHKVPTTLLHSLEGMDGLDWEKLLELQCLDGSLLFSPSSTAFALMQTKDEKCLKYLEKAVERFNGGVPNVYPVDMFEHIWAVDRLERLGISRYFEPEIKECLDYVYRYWSDDGIGWARNTRVPDVDDTAMGFRLLRLHGYDVSADVFRHFEKDGEFFCFVGQSNQAITGMFNLNRASQVSFPGEKILEEAKGFSYKFLREKQACKQLVDKWVITNDLPGEVEYALDFPSYASLPRVEARLYIEQYGGDGDVWIGKTLYRMPYVNNDKYLELAKDDFNRCQDKHQVEFAGLEKWYEEEESWLAGELGISERSLLRAYFLAASSIFEPERAAERLGWARTAVLMEAVSSHLHGDTPTGEVVRRALIRNLHEFCTTNGSIARAEQRKRTGRKGLVGALLNVTDLISLDSARAHGQGGGVATTSQLQYHIRQHLRRAWADWILAWRSGEEGDVAQVWPDEAALLLVRTLEICAGRFALEEPLFSSSQGSSYTHLASLTTSLCRRLHHPPGFPSHSEPPEGERKTKINGSRVRDDEVESDMQELVQCVIQNTDSTLDRNTKQTFLTVAKSFCYVATCPPDTLDLHIAKVLFERVFD